jgi:exonuclease SbcC
MLAELSGGAYALSVDARSGGFGVVDHTNASQVRSARTLSGGETFLASLALALALADQVAGLASSGAARLESLFLDEGFGTLDPDTLDVVATALDELGARGRMVGVVTHVRELADRLPVRFEVRKVGGASVVERVDQ